MKEILNEWKKFLDKKIILEVYDNQEFLDKETKRLLDQGYYQVNKIALPDNVYKQGGAGFVLEILYPDGKKSTGYQILLRNGIRGYYSGEVSIKNQIIGQPFTNDIYAIFFNAKNQTTPFMTITTQTSQKLPQDVVEGDPPKVNVQKGRASFILNEKYYIIDLSNIFPGVSGLYSFASVRAEDYKQYIPNAKTGSIIIGFQTIDGTMFEAFYIDNQGKPVVEKIDSRRK